MPEWTIQWAADAQADLREIIEFIAARGDSINALRIFERLASRVQSLALSPQRGRRVPELTLELDPPLREIIERPWRIMYSCEHGRVMIVAIIDGRRDVLAALASRLGNDWRDEL